MATSVKRIIFFVLGGAILLLLLFHSFLFSVFTGWMLKTYTLSRWGEVLHYDQVYWKQNHLIITQPRLAGEQSFVAKQLILTFEWNWWPRQLHLDLAIDQPYWHLHPSAPSTNWEKWKGVLNREEKWFKTHLSFHIQQGVLHWTLPDSSTHQLYLEGQADGQKGGYAAFSFNAESQQTNPDLTLQATSTAESMAILCNFQTVNCADLIALVQLISPNFYEWSVYSGTLEGQLEATFPKIQRPYLEGELHLTKLAFVQRSTDLKGEIEEAHVQINKNLLAYQGIESALTVMGKLDILKPSTLSYAPSNQTIWRIENILGRLQLDVNKVALLDLSGQSLSSQLQLRGEAHLQSQQALAVNLSLNCLSSLHDLGQVHLRLHPLEKQRRELEIQLEHLAYTDCNFLQLLLTTYLPFTHKVNFEKGWLEGHLVAQLSPEGIEYLQIKQVAAHDMRCQVGLISCEVMQTEGNLEIALNQEDPWQSLQAQFQVQNGSLQFKEMTPPLSLTAIQSHLHIKEGQIQHSLMNLELAGLKGSVDMEWDNTKQLLNFKLEGKGQDLAELLPTSFQEGLKENFYDNHLSVLATLKRQHTRLELGGTFHIQRAFTDDVDLIHFGCELKKLVEESGTHLVPVGWFYAHELPLEKFLSPFIFKKGKLQMRGRGEIKGTFDEQYLTIKYDADQLEIENEDLLIKAPHLHALVPSQLIGFHQINLHTNEYQGRLPLQKASYLEKNSGLLFEDIQGVVHFKNKSVSINPIEAYCEGIYFGGILELDYRDPSPGVFELRVNCPTLSGKISQIQHLLAHLKEPSLLSKIPLEGEILGHEEGLKLSFAFVPHDYHLQATIKGVVVEGSLPFESADLALKGLYMDVNYQHQPQQLELSDIQGTLLVGKPRCVEEYIFTGDHLRLQNMEDPNIDLDIQVSNQTQELLRLVGHTQEREEGIKTFILDKHKSHLSHIYPHVWHLDLKEGLTIEHFEFYSSFDLKNVVKDLQCFERTGLWFLSQRFLEKFTHLPLLDSPTNLSLHYRPHEQVYAYQLEANPIQIGEEPPRRLHFYGRKQNQKWMIDHLEWNDVVLSAELQQQEERWLVPFLGINMGQTLVLGLKGEILPQEETFRATVNLCELNLAQLSQWPLYQAYADFWQPQGKIQAIGEMELKNTSAAPGYSLEAHLQAQSNDLSLRNVPIKIVHPFPFHWQSDRLMHLQQVALQLLAQEESPPLFIIPSLSYQTLQNQLSCPQLSFQIPSQHLIALGEIFQQNFSDLMGQTTRDLIVECKKEGELKGECTFEQGLAGQKMQLKLADGLYFIKKQPYSLKQLEVTLNDQLLTFSTFSQHENCPFQLQGKMDWPACQQGELIYRDQLPHLASSFFQPLTISWQNEPDQGLFIRSIEGQFAGCQVYLKQELSQIKSSDWIPLKGEIAFDFNELCPLMTADIAENIYTLKLGSLYRLQGQFKLNINAGLSFLERFYFKGELTSQEAIVKGYKLQSLKAQMQYVPGRLNMQNLQIEDAAGQVEVKNLTLLHESEKESWSFFIPQLIVKNLRPFLLRGQEISETMEEKESKLQPLLIKRFELQKFYGQLNQISTWQAEGDLQFSNSTRKNGPEHLLLAIPAEILLRLGLNTQLLNPVTGTIYFFVKGDRFYLQRFKDTYSEGRASKFYLADSLTPSWMDFKGNLFVQIRMKQYNLIFKLAELFTVSVQGNIKKPVYALQKQVKMPHKGH